MIRHIRISKKDEIALCAATSCKGFHGMSSDAEQDYSAVFIEKPWGHEYSVVRSDASDVWFLSIKHGERTSMHCHPTKKTSLILLGGTCEVTTFNEKITLQAGEGIVIDKGVFHSTQALSKAGIALLETETPVNKADLIRLNDIYGRAGKKYESGKHIHARNPASMPSFYEPDSLKNKVTFAECHLSVHDISDVAHFKSTLADFSSGLVVVLNGEIRGVGGELLFSHADAFHAHDVLLHNDALSLTGVLRLLYLKKTL